MGNWCITIQGIGCHHNKDSPKDANQMTKDFVKQLQQAGHAIESAVFTYGGRDVILGIKHIYPSGNN